MARGETYEQYVEKFKRKRTTDDTFTPPDVYEAVLSYVERHYGVDRNAVVRPFWPDSDYKDLDYEGKVVVDNPPFSIEMEILDWYNERGIPYFLFCNGKTCANVLNHGTSLVCGDFGIVYENGAKVRTAFATNLEPLCARNALDLQETIKSLRPSKARTKTPRGKNEYTSLDLLHIKKPFKVEAADFEFVRKNPMGKEYFGQAIRTRYPLE